MMLFWQAMMWLLVGLVGGVGIGGLLVLRVARRMNADWEMELQRLNRDFADALQRVIQAPTHDV